MSHSPFISTQRLFQLVAPPERRRAWLRPETFRLLRGRNGEHAASPPDEEFVLEGDADVTREPGFPPVGQPRQENEGWVVVDRVEFLTNLDYRRQCITVDAGVGKTKALRQTQYLLPRQHPGHLALATQFSRLPESSAAYLDASVRGAVPWLVQLLTDTPATAEMNVSDAERLIRRKIRAGQFTLLVDALDQLGDVTEARTRVQNLAAFLDRYPDARCLVTGRPYAIQRCWRDLFDSPVHWEFAQVGVFDPAERERFVGTPRFRKLRAMDADVMVLPRALEAVRGIPIEQLGDVRTAADVYWRSIWHLLELAFEGQEGQPSRDAAIRLFSLLGSETTSRKLFDGVEPGEKFDALIYAIWIRRKVQLRGPGFGIDSLDAFKAELERLGRLNEILDFAALDHEGLKQIFWRSRTLQHMFAALWITRYATPDDRRWLVRHVYVTDNRTHDWYEMWRLACEMPGRVDPVPTARWDLPYARTMGILLGLGSSRLNEGATPADESAVRVPIWDRVRRFAATCVDWWHRVPRSTEMIWRCWENMQAIARRAGSDGQPLARAGLDRFCGQFPAILDRGWCGRARRIACDFEQSFRPVPRVAGDSLLFWFGDRPTEPIAIESPFMLSRYTVTNELYSLFNPGHARRFSGYRRYSGGRRCPAILLNWYDAWCVSAWLGGRLPSEREWEYACRAQPLPIDRQHRPSPTHWCCGDAEEQLADYAWYNANSGNTSHPVGTRQPNAFDLCDMHGNVWEWTVDWYDRDSTDEYERLSRVLRGGSFYGSTDFCRSAYRDHWLPTITFRNWGVRVARALRKP